MKFGGTSLGSGKRIKNVGRIILQYNELGTPIIVASAMGGVTDKLISLFESHKDSNSAESDGLLCLLRDIHYKALDDLELTPQINLETYQTLNKLFYQLAVSLHKKNNYDYIVSFGERLSACLLSAELKNIGLKSKFIQSSEIIIVNSTPKAIVVLTKETEQRAKQILGQLISQEIIPVVTGFFASNIVDEVVTLGRGGSDYSATILANALDAKEVILWKDVDGIFNLDPDKNPNSVLYTDLSYDEATILAQNGAKVLHPECLESVASKGITVWVKNSFNPVLRGTRICSGGLL